MAESLFYNWISAFNWNSVSNWNSCVFNWNSIYKLTRIFLGNEDFSSDAESVNGENDDDFDMNSEENDLASLDPHLSEDEIDEDELVKTCKHFRQVSCFYTCFSLFSF